MWKVFIRAGMTFALSVFGRTVIALAALVLLLFAAAILIDLKMYVSAALACVLSSIALVVYATQYRRQLIANRERAVRQKAAAERRAAAAEARYEKVDKAKSAMKDTVKGMTAGAAGVAKTGFTGARDRIQGWRNQTH